MLIERDGEIVTRDEIENELWSKDMIVEFDHSINVAIAKLRKALGDSADEPKYIETVASRGYRLMVPVERIETARGGGTDGSLKPEPGSWVGKEVSHYHVGEFIGSTRTGLVYAGSDNELLRIRTTYGRRVAMKLLPEEAASDAIALRCFEREAFIASSLQHPNICHVHSLAKQDGRLFIVMELLEGRTLRGCLASGVLRGTGLASQVAVDKLLDIAIQISDGLAAAHGEGIIHRDIRPDNIFITKQGIVKILDLGLAHVLGSIDTQSIPELNAFAAALPESSDSSLDSALSRVRRGLMGFVAYKSPEQVRGEQLDARTDLFSLGLVLYEMATGRCAATIEMKEELHNAIVSQVPPPVRELRPDLPPKLAQVVDKALEKDRERRYQSAAALRADLASFKREMESGSTARGAGQHSTEEPPTVSAFCVPSSAIEQQTRFLEAAAPKEATVGRSIEVVAMVRREESGGLRGYLRAEAIPRLTAEDVRERAFELEFAMDANGTPEPADITLRLDSPGFEPRAQTKKLRVPPRGDSAPCTFLVTPQVAGELVANLELLNPGEQIVASRSIRTTAVVEGVTIDSDKVVVTLAVLVSKNTGEVVKVLGKPPKGEPSPADLVGKKICHYRVLQVISRGGTGVVYMAQDLRQGTVVVLKFLPQEVSGDPSALQGFEQEARTAWLREHPNSDIAPKVQEYDGCPFIEMPLRPPPAGSSQATAPEFSLTASTIPDVPVKTPSRKRRGIVVQATAPEFSLTASTIPDVPVKTPSRKRRGIVVAASTLLLMLAFTFFNLTITKWSHPTSKGSQTHSEEWAIVSLEAINKAEAIYSASHPHDGFTLDLAGLSDAQQGELKQLIDRDSVIGRSEGYTFTYKPGAKVNGTIRSYTITAAPEKPEKTGRWFFSDESGKIRYNIGGPADGNSPPLDRGYKK